MGRRVTASLAGSGRHTGHCRRRKSNPTTGERKCCLLPGSYASCPSRERRRLVALGLRHPGWAHIGECVGARPRPCRTTGLGDPFSGKAPGPPCWLTRAGRRRYRTGTLRDPSDTSQGRSGSRVTSRGCTAVAESILVSRAGKGVVEPAPPSASTFLWPLPFPPVRARSAPLPMSSAVSAFSSIL